MPPQNVARRQRAEGHHSGNGADDNVMAGKRSEEIVAQVQCSKHAVDKSKEKRNDVKAGN